ncbi:L-tyrosine/L-tryptophan isonitrile synthase family protein [Micromonospora sp. NPDC049559]|uniref:L-tyrosine/L-tryptophan isonitrile synthase family protein n=1 Tax=Micromonospora sp. NPDC049559 TaxID=3155923 RepID=UPI00342B577D
MFATDATLTWTKPPTWTDLRRMLRADPMLRLYAACPPAPPAPGGPASPGPLFPDHPAVPKGSETVSARELAAAPALARAVLTHPSLGAVDVPDALVEYLLRPMLRVFRTSLDRYGWALVDPGADVLFELTPEGAPTGRVVVAELSASPLPPQGATAVESADDDATHGHDVTLGGDGGATHDDGDDATFGAGGGVPGGAAGRLAAVAALATAGAAASGRDPAVVLSTLDTIVVAELRFLQPATARRLRADPRWARYAHAGEAGTEEAVGRLLDLVRRARVPDGTGHRAAPVVRLLRSPGDAGPVGLARLRQEIFHLGGELREADPTPATVATLATTGRLRVGAPPPPVPAPEPAETTPRPETTARPETTPGGGSVFVLDTVERAPDTWRQARPYAPPALSYAPSLSSVRVGELRRNPLARRYAVHWSAAQTDALVSRLVSTAKSSAARTAENAVASRSRTDRRLGAVERQARLVYHVLRRRQFRLGTGADYPVEQALGDLMPVVARGEPVRLVLMCFATKFSHSRLKAPGPLPDLADLAMTVRLAELVGALGQVYPPGARVTLVLDGEHFRRHPLLPLEQGFRTRIRYAEAVGADFLEIREYGDLIAQRIEPARRREHAEFAERVRREHRRAFAGLDVTVDPLTALSRAAAVDPRGNFVPLFRSLVHSVPVPEPVGMPMLAWAQSLYAELYEVHAGVPAELRQARRALLRTTWDDTLEYLAAWYADREAGYRQEIVPNAVLASVRPGRNRLGLNLLGGAPIPSWHATGAIDARGTISADFHLSLHDQGFVPLYSPLLGTAQPFAMVPVTAVRLAPSAAELELAPDFVASIGLRRR